MKISSVVICLVLFYFICGFGNALMIYQNESQLILTSDQIVYGKIVDVKSAWNAQKTHIETTAQILVDEAYVQNDKAVINSGTIIPVTILGGTDGNITECVEDMPVFVLNTDAFIYLEKTKNGKFTVHGLERGIHPIVSDYIGKLKGQQTSSTASTVEQFKEEIKMTLQGIPVDVYPPGVLSKSPSASLGAPGDPTISSVTPSTARAGIDTIIITGSGFGTTHLSNGKVLFFKEAISYSGGILNWISVNNNSEIIAWTDTQIQVKVPVGASSGFVVVRTDSNIDSNYYPFAVSFSYGRTKWGSSPTFYVNPGSISGFTTAIQNAANPWNNVPGTSFRLNYGGTSTKTGTAGDLSNDISMGPPEDFTVGTLAQTISYFYTGYPETIVDCDVEFNPAVTWTTGTASGSTYSVEAIMIHEFGHWIKLKDLYGDLPQIGVPGGYPSDLSPQLKMMFGKNGDEAGNMNLKTLASADIAGIQYIYPGSTTITILPSSLTAITVNIPYTQVITANGGTTPYSYSITSGALPSGLSLSSSGTISGTPTVVGTSAFTITATDANLQTGLQSFSLMVNAGNSNNAVVQKTFQFGKTGDVAVSGDWDGNGVQDVGVFRPSNGNWYLATDNGIMLMWFHFGTNGDIPVVGDWDHNGVSDIGVFRPSNGNWYLDTTKAGVVNKTFHFGTLGDVPVVKDWNSDGASDPGVFRPSNGNWYFNYTPFI